MAADDNIHYLQNKTWMFTNNKNQYLLGYRKRNAVIPKFAKY